MMRFFLVPSSRLAAAVIVLVAGAACGPEREPKIAVGVDGCSACGMRIDRENETAGYFIDRDFHPFCSSGCLLQSYEKRRQQGMPLPERVVFADYEGSGVHPAEEMSFLLTEDIPTVMQWGILAFVDRQAAVVFRRSDEDRVVDWLQLRALRGQPDRTLELVLGRERLEPEIIRLEKGSLVVLEIEGQGLEESQVLQLRGYEHLGQIVVPATVGKVSFRLLAIRPGEGFPLIRESDGEIVGRVVVSGAHTPDEEEL